MSNQNEVSLTDRMLEFSMTNADRILAFAESKSETHKVLQLHNDKLTETVLALFVENSILLAEIQEMKTTIKWLEGLYEKATKVQ